MAGGIATNVIAVKHDRPPKQVIWDDLEGWLDKIQPTGSDCVVCVYERPHKTAGGILMPETSSRVAEDKFQGVVGLIVKLGPNFGSHERALGLKPMPQVNDWIAFKSVDCVPFTLGARSMRLLQGNFIRMVLSNPDCVI